MCEIIPGEIHTLHTLTVLPVSDQKIHQNNKKYKCCRPNNHDCRVQPNKLDLGYKTKHMTTQQ